MLGIQDDSPALRVPDLVELEGPALLLNPSHARGQTDNLQSGGRHAGQYISTHPDRSGGLPERKRHGWRKRARRRCAPGILELL